MAVRNGLTDPEGFLIEVFAALYRRFGPRRWWPAESPFEVIVGAILTQNVAWKNVETAIGRLRTAGLLSPEALLAAPEEAIEACIRPSGYFRQKRLKLLGFCRHLAERHAGSLERMFGRPLAELRAELLGLHGIGPETADAILCYAGGFPVMVMDAYTRRVFHRLGVFPADASYDRMQAWFHAHVPAETSIYNEFHALIDGLANRICTKRGPRCGECPLAALCPSAASGAGIAPGAGAAPGAGDAAGPVV